MRRFSNECRRLELGREIRGSRRGEGGTRCANFKPSFMVVCSLSFRGGLLAEGANICCFKSSFLVVCSIHSTHE